VTDADTLNVWNENRLVGSLWRNQVGYIGFRYDSNWIESGGFAVSRTIPLSVEVFSPEDGIAHRFFANLLPEGGVRNHIVRDLRIPDTDFDLLRAIGGECAGALTLLPVEKAPSGERSYRLL
jgi:serine/threonine-protein kinase HipA